MWNELFGPSGASKFAHDVDLLSIFLLGSSVLFVAGVCLTVLWFCFRYRARTGHEPESASISKGAMALWTTGPLVVVLALFFWGSRIEAGHGQAPPESIEIKGSAQQWMWTFHRDEGPTEINALHLPVDVPVRLRLESEDVVHRLSMPVFRTQQEALPGLTTEQWFRPTREGSYRFYCTEFCGAGHSSMSGTVYVLDPITYEHWVTGDAASMTPEEAGELLFAAFRCDSCHIPEGNGTGPALVGRFGKDAKFGDGSAVTFDAAYVRESLLEPKAKVVEGYEPVMPSYKGQLDESQIGQLSAYLESLSDG